MSFVIGIDVGTQSSKGVLVEAGRGVVATASAPHRVSFPAPNWAQQDPTDWTSAVASVIGSLVAEAGPAAVRDHPCSGRRPGGWSGGGRFRPATAS